MKLNMGLSRRGWGLTALLAATTTVGLNLAIGPAASGDTVYKGVPPPTPSTFAQCPLGARVSPTNARVADCLVGVTSQGTIDIGGLDTTFRGPGVIQGGINLDESFNGTFNFAQALDGQSYSAPRQLLSKPVLAALGYPAGVKSPAQSQVYVTTQQAGPILFGSTNGALITVVPLSFHLLNPLLGAGCSIGTDLDPVTLTLSTGTSGSLTGQSGTLLSGNGGHTIQTIGTEVVDGTFSVPGATGCGSGGVWNSALDTANSLPSPSGANVAVLYGNFAIGEASWVARKLHP